MPTESRQRPACTHLLYLHGFRSSPRSFKAQRMAAWVQMHRPDLVWCCPQLPPSPREAMRLIEDTIADWPQEQMAVMGSSLGGFYARCVAARWHCRTVLLNPAVDPARDLQRHIGEHSCWQDPTQRFVFDHSHVAELRAMQPPPLRHPERVMAVIAKGDEVLDWREMQASCANATVRLLEGSDHGLSDFDNHLQAITCFLEL